MRSILVFCVAVLLLPLSGCLDDSGSRTIAGKAQLQGKEPRTYEEIRQKSMDQIRALMEGVPCQAPVGMETSKNLRLLNNITFESRGSNEIDIHDDLIAMARGGGFALANLSDPLEIHDYAQYAETKGNLDVKFSPDGQSVLVGAGWGIDVVDITNPFEPVRSGQFRFESVPQFPGEIPLRNAHMIYTALIKNEQWVFLAPNSNTGVWILKLEGAPAERSLKYVTHTLAVEGGPLGPHDMYVQFDPDAKKWLLYSADGYHGWAVFDVSNPAEPMLVGGLIRPEGGYTHTIQAAKINGKRIVATIGEVGVNLLEVYDATNLQAPMLLGVWNIAAYTMPANPAGLVFPQHNFNIVAGKLYLAHYGSGLFVFDLTKVTSPVAGTNDLKPIAHYASGGAPQSQALSFGSFWDVVLKDGLVYGSNMGNGVHIIGFGCNPVGEPLLSSDG